MLSALILTCASATPLFPALELGAAFTFDGHCFRARPTRTSLRHICAAIAEGSIVVEPNPGPLYDEIERRIIRDRDQLLARAEALLATAPTHLLRAG